MSPPRRIDPIWKPILDFNGIASFEQLWTPAILERAEITASPNGSVQKIWLQLPEGGETPVYLKRREDEALSSIARMLKRKLPLENEAAHAARLRELGIITPQVIWFEQISRGDRVYSVLLTRALEEFISLHELLSAWRRPALLDNGRRRMILDAVSETILKLHSAEMAHHDLSPKHILIRFEDSESCMPRAEVGLVDLELCRRHRVSAPWQDDLAALNSKTPIVSRSERLRFLRRYLGSRGQAANRRLIRRLTPRS